MTLRINDGATVEVTDGLADGDTILQFVPGAPSMPADVGFVTGPGGVMMQSCTVTPDGASICKGG